MVMVLTIVSFIAILGVIAMSTALLNIKMRGLNRSSDKNFYYLETALDEIHAQLGRTASEILKEEYADILSRLYTEDLDTNEKANDELAKALALKLRDEFDVTLSEDAEVQAENCAKTAEKLKTYAATFTADADKKEQFQVTVGAVDFQKKASEAIGTDQIYSGLVFRDVCLTYINPDTDIESALTVDLRIDTPYVRFINGGDALLDYILVANEEVLVTSEGATSVESTWNGSVFGGLITVDHSTVNANTSLMTAAGKMTVKNNGELNIGPEIMEIDAAGNEEDGTEPEEAEKTVMSGSGRVWADGIELLMNSTLTTKNTSMFVRDDMTLNGNKNEVILKGSYYGYGNEGLAENGTLSADASKSSAILLNDKSSRVNLRGLDSLMLAGRAYLRFNTKTGDVANQSQYIYPMGESLAVRATQAVYLVPEEYIRVNVTNGGGEPKAAGVNPVIMPETADALTITVALPGKAPHSYEVSRGNAESGNALMINDNGDNTPAFLVALNGKIYVYYNFQTETERSLYFESYLKNHAESFDALLEKGGVNGSSDSGGIFINEDSQLQTSGSLYQVTGGNAAGENLFELLNTRSNELSSSLSWVEFGNNLLTSFGNLKKNLAETMRVPADRLPESGGDTLLPAGSYVRLKEVEALAGTESIEENGCSIILSPGDVSLNVSGSTAAVHTAAAGVSGSAQTDLEQGGLIISAGDVTITGNGEFRGLILAKGTITVNDSVTLTADASLYEPVLALPEAAKYFYDYSDAASTVLNHYDDFVTRENWRRSGLEQGGAQ